MYRVVYRIMNGDGTSTIDKSHSIATMVEAQEFGKSLMRRFKNILEVMIESEEPHTDRLEITGVWLDEQNELDSLIYGKPKQPPIDHYKDAESF